MKKQLIVIFLCCSVFAASPQQNKWFTIKAFLPQWNGAEVSLFSNNKLIHKDKVVKDMFSFTGHIDMITPGLFQVKLDKTIFYVPVFIEPGTIKVRDAGGKTLSVS